MPQCWFVASNWSDLLCSSIPDFVAYTVILITIVATVTAVVTRKRRWRAAIVSDWSANRERSAIILLIIVTVGLHVKPDDWWVICSVPVFLIGTYLVIPLTRRSRR